jgi:hypothetical protein
MMTEEVVSMNGKRFIGALAGFYLNVGLVVGAFVGLGLERLVL